MCNFDDNGLDSSGDISSDISDSSIDISSDTADFSDCSESFDTYDTFFDSDEGLDASEACVQSENSDISDAIDAIDETGSYEMNDVLDDVGSYETGEFSDNSNGFESSEIFDYKNSYETNDIIDEVENYETDEILDDNNISDTINDLHDSDLLYEDTDSEIIDDSEFESTENDEIVELLENVEDSGSENINYMEDLENKVWNDENSDQIGTVDDCEYEEPEKSSEDIAIQDIDDSQDYDLYYKDANSEIIDNRESECSENGAIVEFTEDVEDSESENINGMEDLENKLWNDKISDQAGTVADYEYEESEKGSEDIIIQDMDPLETFTDDLDYESIQTRIENSNDIEELKSLRGKLLQDKDVASFEDMVDQSEKEKKYEYKWNGYDNHIFPEIENPKVLRRNNSNWDESGHYNIAEEYQGIENIEENGFDSTEDTKYIDIKSSEFEKKEEYLENFKLEEPENDEMTESKELDELRENNLSDDEKAHVIREFVDQNVSPSVLPRTGGHWQNADETGNSRWILDDDTVISWRKGGEKHSLTGAELKQKYDFEGVDYKENEPDFEPFEDDRIGHVEIENFTDSRTAKDGTYTAATCAAAKKLGCEPKEIIEYMEENGLTWHECGDRKTVRAIPAEINSAFKHTGGIGIEKSMNAVEKAIQNKYGDISFERKGLSGSVSKSELDCAVENVRKIFRDTKKRI